ncbi:MAG: SDR family oxidoreductase [Actinomycetota bacterium]|jgi:short-subunit dehydrogenase
MSIAGTLPGHGRVAVVTGAAGGLGKAFCDELQTRGYEVVGVDIRGTQRRLDVTDAQACRDLARELRPDVWINNAGVLGSGSAAEQSDEQIAQVVSVNLLGVINGSRAAVSVMRERGSGHILNMGSLASWLVPPGETVYSATKHAVRAFSVGLAGELRGTGIRISLLCPDGIWTPMLYDRLDDPHSAMSFTASRLLDPVQVARRGMRLLEHPRLAACIPSARGLLSKLAGINPPLNLRAARMLARKGQKVQARMKAEQAKTQQ